MEGLWELTNALSNDTVPDLLRPSPRLGVRNPTLKLQSLLYQERVKLRNANLVDTFKWFIRTKADYKFGRKGSVGVSRDCSIFEYPLLSATNFKFGRYIHRVHPNKSPLQIWEKRERGRIQELPKFLSTSYYLRNR